MRFLLEDFLKEQISMREPLEKNIQMSSRYPRYLKIAVYLQFVCLEQIVWLNISWMIAALDDFRPF